MIISLINLGKALLEEETKKLGDSKRALINLLIEKRILEDRQPGRNKRTELFMDTIVINCDHHEATIDESLRREINTSLLEKYNYVFESFHPKRQRPRLTIRTRTQEKIIKRFEEMINKKQIVDMISELERIGRATEKMLQLGEILEQICVNDLKWRIKESEATLYTLAIRKKGDLIDLATLEGYRDLVYADIRLEHELRRGVCSTCGKDEWVVNDPDMPSGSLLKIYITDQPGFLSNVPYDEKQKDTALRRTFSICPDCLQEILVGYHFVVNSDGLFTQINGTNLQTFIIPYSRTSVQKIKDFVENLPYKFKSVSSFEALKEFEEKFQLYDEQDYYFTVIFGSRKQASFRLAGVIREVPVTRLTKYARTTERVIKTLGRLIYPEESNWSEIFPAVLDFKKVGNQIPLRVRDGDVLDVEPLLSLYSSILTGANIHPQLIPITCLTAAKIQYYETSGGYTMKPDTKYPVLKFSRQIITYKILETVIMRMNMGKENLATSYLPPLEEHLVEVMNELALEDWQRPLFLIGYVIGEIGARQMAERQERKTFPPILKSLSFEGMNIESLKRLVADVFEAMKNYDVTGAGVAGAWSAAQLGIQKYHKKMNNPITNLFHILTGYSYSTIRRLSGKAKKEGKTEEEGNEQ